MSADELPEGWITVALGAFVESMANGVYKPEGFYTHDGVPSLRMYNIQDGAVVWQNLKRMRLTKDEIHQYQLLPGDILVNRVNSRELVGKAAICAHFPEPTVFESKSIRVRLRCDLVEPGYVNYLLQANDNRGKLSDSSKQTVGMATASQPQISSLELPFPPLAEQRRIVAQVEALLARVNAARARLAKVPALLKRFRQSVLAAACSGRLTVEWRERQCEQESVRRLLDRIRQQADPVKTRRDVPDTVELPASLDSLDLPVDWLLVSTAELLRAGILLDLKDGNHGANHPKVSDFTTKGLPFITAAQVRDYEIDYNGAYHISGERLKKLPVGFARPGDAVLTHKGSVGRSTLNTRACVLTPQTTYYRCSEEYLSSSYLVYLFGSPQFYGQLHSVMSQTTRDFVPISEQYRLFVILPPLTEQHEIVRRVEALFKLADAIEKRVAAATGRAEKLTQAILAKAFRGELVPTEAEPARRERRAYEPASVLLERIRAEGVAQALSNGSRKPGQQKARSKAD